MKKGLIGIGLIAAILILLKANKKRFTGEMSPEDWTHGKLAKIVVGKRADGYYLRKIWEDGYWSERGGMDEDELSKELKELEGVHIFTEDGEELAKGDIVSLSYRKLDDGVYVKILYYNGMLKKGIEKNEETFNLYIRNAKRAGATINEF